MEDKPISRRNVLAKGALLGGAILGGYAYRDRIAGGAVYTVEELYRLSRRRNDTSLDGIPDDLKQSEAFHAYIEDTFDTEFEGLDSEAKELIVDARYVEGESFSEESKQYITDLFDHRTDITLHWLDYPETYPRDEFIDEYDHNPANILWREDGFYDEEVDDLLKQTALQVVFAPGREKPPNGRLHCGPENEHIAGFSAVNRSVVGDSGTEEDRLKTTLHEIAHLGNYQHNYDDPHDRGVLGQNDVADLTLDQWERLEDRLYMVSVEAPEQVYEMLHQYAGCEDVVLPFE